MSAAQIIVTLVGGLTIAVLAGFFFAAESTAFSAGQAPTRQPASSAATKAV